MQYHHISLDRITRATDAIGKLRDFGFDANGNVTREDVLDPANPGAVLDRTSFTYDAADRRTAATAFGNFTSTTQYDARGNPIRVTNPDGYSLSFDYDPNNHVTRAADPENNSLTRTLDPDGRPRSVTDANGHATTYEYWGITSMTSGLVKHDGRLKRTTAPRIQSFSSGLATEYEYDANGNVTEVTLMPAGCGDPCGSARVTRTTGTVTGTQRRVQNRK